MNCICKKNEEYFDLKFLSMSKRKVDNLIEETRFKFPNLKNYYKRNHALKQFNDITLQLVEDFESYAKTYIQFLITNKNDYGILYLLAQNKLFNLLYIEYITFPLIDLKNKKVIIEKIEKIAQNNKISCLELLYFFALLVNPNYNWITMDYIANGNKNHQYVVLE